MIVADFRVSKKIDLQQNDCILAMRRIKAPSIIKIPPKGVCFSNLIATFATFVEFFTPILIICNRKTVQKNGLSTSCVITDIIYVEPI